MIDLDEAPAPPTLAPELFDQLQNDLKQGGPLAAVDRLCTALEELKDYHALFYAKLMRKRVELGISPFPTGSSNEIPEAMHSNYEQAIREAGRLVGNLYLAEKDYSRAWFFYRMLDEPQPVHEAIEAYEFNPEDDCQSIIDVALYQGVHPKKGFDLALQRYGICSAITIFSSTDWSKYPDARDHAVGQLIEALYDQLEDRLKTEIAMRGETVPQHSRVADLIENRAYLFEDGAYHIDTSHLSSVIQFSLELTRGNKSLGKARQLAAYGAKLAPHFKQDADPPFENSYADYRVLLEILDGYEVEAGLKHFEAKIEPAFNEGATFPAEVYINILLKLQRIEEALRVAKIYLAEVNRPTVCPNVYELCQIEKDYAGWAEVARKRADGVNYLASLIQIQS